jgi:catalase (peroxidase I)
MTVLFGAVRVLNDFFVNVLDLGTRWKPKTGCR